jgi:hypothetical protein
MSVSACPDDDNYVAQNTARVRVRVRVNQEVVVVVVVMRVEIQEAVAGHIESYDDVGVGGVEFGLQCGNAKPHRG